MQWLARLVRMVALTAVVLGIIPQAASAQPVEQRYLAGPSAICLGDFAFALHAGEVAGGAFREGGWAPRIGIRSREIPGTIFDFVAPPMSLDGRRHSVRQVRTPGGLPLRRYDFPRQNSYRAGIPGEVVGVIEAAHREYDTMASVTMPDVHIVSGHFAGPARNDAAVLSRLVPAASAPCGEFVPESRFSLPIRGEMIFVPVAVPPSRQICRDGMTLTVSPGERVFVSLPIDALSGAVWRVETPGGVAYVGGYSRRTRNGPVGLLRDLDFVENRQNSYIGFTAPERYRDRRSGELPALSISTPEAPQSIADALIPRIGFADPRDRHCWN